MTAYLTRLPEDPFFEWRIHADKRGVASVPRVIHLTGGELESIIEQYNQHNPVDKRRKNFEQRESD